MHPSPKEVFLLLPPQDAVPDGVVLLVRLLLDVDRDVLLCIIVLQCLSSTLH